MNDASIPEFNPGGFVPDGPQDVVMLERTVFIRIDASPAVRQLAAVQEFIGHMAEQDPERLEQDRAEAWGYTYDPTRHSPDAMTVTFDRDPEE